MNYGIITADFVQSSQLEANDKTNLYNATEKILSALFGDNLLVYEWFRGDSFQVQVKNIQNCCRIALTLKMMVRSIENAKKPLSKINDIRMSIGIGTVDFKKESLAQSDGTAFQLSGRGLDKIKSSKQNFIISSEDENNKALQIESLLLDTILNNTTVMQCKVLLEKLSGMKEEDIAQKLGLAQSTVNQHANAGNWNSISNYISYFEKIYGDV